MSSTTNKGRSVTSSNVGERVHGGVSRFGSERLVSLFVLAIVVLPLVVFALMGGGRGSAGNVASSADSSPRIVLMVATVPIADSVLFHFDSGLVSEQLDSPGGVWGSESELTPSASPPIPELRQLSDPFSRLVTARAELAWLHAAVILLGGVLGGWFTYVMAMSGGVSSSTPARLTPVSQTAPFGRGQSLPSSVQKAKVPVRKEKRRWWGRRKKDTPGLDVTAGGQGPVYQGKGSN